MKKLEVIQYPPQDTNFILFYDSQENIEYVTFFQGIEEDFKLSDLSDFVDTSDKRFYNIFKHLYKDTRLMPSLERAWEIWTEIYLNNEVCESDQDILNNVYEVFHLPPTYEPSISKNYITHFTEQNGWFEECIEQVVNMCKGDRLDLEDIVIVRTV